MSDDEARALGERWIKAGGGFPDGSLFRTGVPIWLFGKRYEPGTPFRVDGDVMDHEAEGRLKGAWPDLRDPATIGTWLATVRERYDDPTAHTRYSHEWSRWYVYIKGDVLPGGHLTEAEALVSALESKEPA